MSWGIPGCPKIDPSGEYVLVLGSYEFSVPNYRVFTKMASVFLVMVGGQIESAEVIIRLYLEVQFILKKIMITLFVFGG